MAQSFVEKITAELQASGATTEVLAFILVNRSLMERLGLETVQRIVALVQNHKIDEARLLLDAQLGPEQIAARMEANAEELAADTKAREKFVSDLKAFGWQLAPVLLKVGIGLASGGTAL